MIKQTKKQIYDEVRTTEILDELAEIGSTSYKPEYVNGISRFEKIGKAISHSGNFVREGYELANTIAEDWNAHNMVAAVDFLLGKPLWGEYQLEMVARIVSGEHTIAANSKDSGRKVKISLLVEDVK